MKDRSLPLLTVLDLAGTLLFGVEGAMTAIGGNLDLLGLMVLGFATALAGGIIRDLLIGAVPPDSLRDWRYSATAVSGAVLVFFLHHFVQAVPNNIILVLDAAGLAMFTAAGTEKALEYEMHPFVAVLLGTLTGIGGGTVRDILLARTPIVLRADVYATAAIAGSAVMIVARRLGVHPVLAAFLGGAACFLLRMISVWLHWNLPRVAAP